MMKRKVLLILVLAALACLLCFSCAFAADSPIVCVMELSPEKLAGPGTVNVTITVSNSGDTDLEKPVTLYDPAAQIVSDFGTNGSALLKAGESKTWTGTYDVSQRTLEQGVVVYYVRYTAYRDNGEEYEDNQAIRQKISIQTAEADIDVKRTISPTVAREGQEVVVKYDIVNSGTITLTDIKIKENSDIYKKELSIEKLEPGQTAQVPYPAIKMGKKNLTSGATITYKAENDKKTQTYTVEDATITYGESSLTAKLTSNVKGVAVNEKVMLTLELKNIGSVDYSDLRVTDPSLGDVFTNQKLEAGKSLTLEKEITLPATTDYQFTITAIDSTGTETVAATDALTLTAVNPEDVLTLNLVATADRTEVYTQPGLVRFTLQITNDSGVDAKKVVVSHGSTEIYTFETIPAGESRTLTRDTALSMAGKYRFTAVAQDPIENSLTFQSNDVQIAFSVPTPAPATATPPPVPTEEPTFSPVTMAPISHNSIGTIPKLIQSILLPILIISGLLLIASCVLLIIATKRRVDQKKASEAALDHLERSKRRDYVTPAEEEELEPEETIKPTSVINDEADTLDDSDFELPHMKYARSAAAPADGKSDFSTIGEGLYDEEMTSDLSAYDGHSDDSVMYEQPYDDANTVEDAYDNGVYEDDGYTDGLMDGYADSDPASADYDDAGTDYDSAGNAYGDDEYQEGYDDAVYGDAAYDEATANTAYDAGYDAVDDGYEYDDPNDGHLPDDREGGYDGGSAEANDDMFKRPAQGGASSRVAGRRSRQGSGEGNLGM